MSSKRLLVATAVLVLLAFLCLGIAVRPEVSTAGVFRPVPVALASIDAYVGEVEPAHAETLSYVIQAGEVLIVNLPEILGSYRVNEYRIKRAPALSWLVQRSFFWRTLPKDVGKHELQFRALAGGRGVEDLVVIVEVR